VPDILVAGGGASSLDGLGAVLMKYLGARTGQPPV